MRVDALGNILGSVRYLGSCIDCRAQFMSTSDRVVALGGCIYCERCARAREPEWRDRLARRRAELRDVIAEWSMSNPPSDRGLLSQRGVELENAISDLEGALS